jgi:hypothetical protein
MLGIVKSTLLGLALGVAASMAAQAQAVSSLPAGGGTTPTQGAATQPYVSSQSYYPKPGGSETLKQQHYQATATDADRAAHPYTAGVGPKAN